MDDPLKEIIKSIIAFNTKELKREKGDFQFTDISAQIDRIWDFIKSLSENEEYFVILPTNQQDDLRSHINRINELFTQINNFKPSEVPNPQDIRNSLSQQIKDVYVPIFNYINQLDIYKLTTSGAQADLSNIKDEAKRALEEAKKAKQEIISITETAKKTVSKIPLYKYLGVFSKESEYHKRIAYIWLYITIGLSIILIGILFWVSWDFTINIAKFDSTPKIYAFLILKLFVLAIAIYVLQQSIRNYLANMHLFVLNKHREKSLEVFDAMIGTVKDSEMADQVLSYLAKSIFESGETGFFPGKDTSKDGPDLVQIFKDISKPK